MPLTLMNSLWYPCDAIIGVNVIPSALFLTIASSHKSRMNYSIWLKRVGFGPRKIAGWRAACYS